MIIFDIKRNNWKDPYPTNQDVMKCDCDRCLEHFTQFTTNQKNTRFWESQHSALGKSIMDVFFLGKEHLIHSLTEITHVVDRIIPGPTKWCQINPKGWPILV